MTIGAMETMASLGVSEEALEQAAEWLRLLPVAGPRWWSIFNVWGWPEDCPFPKPAGWDALSHQEKLAHPVGRVLMDSLTFQVPCKERLRYWNCEAVDEGDFCRMTPAEFEEWWEKNKGFVEDTQEQVVNHRLGVG